MIIRAQKNGDYSVIHNGILNDDRLSLKARGLAAYLLTKPDNWRINRDLLAKQFPDGVWAVRGALKELETCGYLTRTRVSNNGRFSWEIVLHETRIPVVENQPVIPVVEKQPIEKQPIENQPSRVSTVVVSTEVVKTVKAVDDDDRANAKIVATKLESAGVVLNALLMDQYMDLVGTYGLRPVLDGITAATQNNKQHSFRYVAACVRNIHDGNDRPRKNGNGAAPVTDWGITQEWDEETQRFRTLAG